MFVTRTCWKRPVIVPILLIVLPAVMLLANREGNSQPAGGDAEQTPYAEIAGDKEDDQPRAIRPLPGKPTEQLHEGQACGQHHGERHQRPASDEYEAKQ